EYRRQTDDARGVSSPVAAVDVVAADGGAHELLGDVVDLVRGFRAAEHPEAARPVFPDAGSNALGSAGKRFVPARHAQNATVTNERLGQSRKRSFHGSTSTPSLVPRGGADLSAQIDTCGVGVNVEPAIAQKPDQGHTEPIGGLDREAGRRGYRAEQG